MPWLTSSGMKERTKFALEWETRWEAGEGRVNVAELCRVFGIARETGYVWLRRYRAAGHDLTALVEKSSRPLTSPTKVSERIENAVIPRGTGQIRPVVDGSKPATRSRTRSCSS